jgi:hypothetical protein
MASESTSEEHRAEVAAAMGKDLGELFSDLADEFVWARLKWQEYEALFDSPDKVELLNEAAPAFFGSLQRTLLDDILMHLCRLTDRATVSGQDTLSLEQLLKAIPDSTLVASLDPLLADVKEKTKPARTFRNKRGAHTDLKVVRGEKVLPGISRAEVRDALTSIHTLLEKVREHYKLSPESFQVIEALGGVDTVLACVRRGVQAHKDWMATLRGSKETDRAT